MSERDQQMEELYEEVFENDLLRTKIIEKVLKSPDGSLTNKNARSLRLVRRSWMETTDSIFRKAQHPLLQFTVGRKPRVSSILLPMILIKRNEDDLQNLWETYMGSGSMPPFSLTLSTFAFIKGGAYLVTLFKLLSSIECIANLLQIRIGIDCHEIHANLSKLFKKLPKNLEFPMVRTFILEKLLNSKYDKHWEILVQSILNRCQNLKKFVQISWGHLYNVRHLKLVFPVTVTHLKISERQLVHVADAVVEGHLLPNLISLSLVTEDSHRRSYHDHIVKFFESVRNTLTEFDIGRSPCTRIINLALHEVSGFPKLQNLYCKDLVLHFYRHVENSMAVDWRVRFPVLKHLNLTWLNNGMNLVVPRGGIKYDSCLSLESLVIGLDWCYDTKNEIIDVHVGDIQRLSWVFPNLVDLHVYVSSFSCLKNVFSVMTSLKKLKVSAWGWGSMDTQDVISVLIGTTAEMMIKLEQDPTLEASFLAKSLHDDSDPTYGPSIRNLKCLEELSLNHKDQEISKSRINLAFRLGFLCLPTLCRLDLNIGFHRKDVPEELINLWESQKMGAKLILPNIL